MKIDTEDLKKIYRSYVQAQIVPSRKKCPSTETIIRLFTTSGLTRKKGRIVDHLSSCHYCAHEFGFFLEIYRQEGILFKEISRLLPQAGRFQVAKKRSPFGEPFGWLDGRSLRSFGRFAVMVLSTIIVVSLMILIFNQNKITQKNTERGRTPGDIQLVTPAHGQAIQPPLIFKWKLVRKYDYAILEIFDEALSPIWKGPRMYNDAYQFPSEAEAKIQKNKVYYWMITIFLADGKVIESALENFTLVE